MKSAYWGIGAVVLYVAMTVFFIGEYYGISQTTFTQQDLSVAAYTCKDHGGIQELSKGQVICESGVVFKFEQKGE